MKRIIKASNNIVNEMWDRLIINGVATEKELQLVTDIVGFNEKAMLDVLYSRTGYRNFDQLDEEEVY